MIIPDYMSKIDSIATGLSAQVEDLGQEILLAWKDFEECVRSVQYDLFANHDLVRQKTRSLIRLLYKIPGEKAADDVAQLREKNAAYGGSWCKRGGTGAFHMLARKADRLDEQLRKHGALNKAMYAYEGESLRDTLSDLRRYLILVEAWHVAKEQVSPEVAGKELIADTVLKQRAENLCTREGCKHHMEAHIAPGTGLFGACNATECGCVMYHHPLPPPIQPPDRIDVSPMGKDRCSETCYHVRGHSGKCSDDIPHF